MSVLKERVQLVGVPHSRPNMRTGCLCMGCLPGTTKKIQGHSQWTTVTKNSLSAVRGCLYHFVFQNWELYYICCN